MKTRAFGVEKIHCPTCNKLVIVALAGHMLVHYTAAGRRCPASGTAAPPAPAQAEEQRP